MSNAARLVPERLLRYTFRRLKEGPFIIRHRRSAFRSLFSVAEVHFSLRILLLASLLGLASCTATDRRGAVVEEGAVTLSAEIVRDSDPDSVDLIVLATVSNNSRSPITLTNVGFGGVLLTGSEARLVMPPATFQPMTLLTQPGGRYVQKLVLSPSYRREEHDLRPGRYRMRFCYRRPGTLFFRPTVEREPNIVKDGVVWSLDSGEFNVVIK